MTATQTPKKAHHRESTKMYTKIATIRHELRISQMELAKLSNVSQSQISKMEKGTIISPAHDKLVRIAEALGRPVSELVDQPDLGEVTTSFRAFNQSTSAAVFIPLHSERQPMNNGFFHEGGIVLRGGCQTQIRKPSFLDYSDDAYAVLVHGDPMQPRYYAGDTLFVDPTAAPRVGDDVAVMIQLEGQLVAVFRECVKLTEASITVLELKSGKEATFQRSDIYGVHVVVGSARGRL